MSPEIAALRPGLEQGAAALGLQLTQGQVDRLLKYLDLLAKWGRVYNLTAVRKPADMLSHHLLDSLAIVRPLRQHTGGGPLRVLDVGSGAGLPGVVLAICCPELSVDCVDTVAKKAAFIQQVAALLGLPGLRGVHARVEHLTGPYGLVCSRAFASLADFVSWSAGALAADGVWLAMKGKPPEEEIVGLPAEVEVFHVERLQVPSLDAQRCVVWMRRRVAASGATPQ
jgi:16S rRNA (guanine527-N7)-methyltransferase